MYGNLLQGSGEVGTMRILVTGGTGFIGKYVVETLRKDGHEVYTVSRNPLPNHTKRQTLIVEKLTFFQNEKHYMIEYTHDNNVLSESINCLLRFFNPDTIIHLAANPIGKPDNDKPFDVIDDNIKLTQAFAHYAPRGCHFINASSIVVYGSTPQPVFEMAPMKPIGLYATTKASSEMILEYYKEANDLKVANLRLCATVGKGQTHGVIPDFIRKLRENPTLEMLGDYPGATKPYVYIDDVVRAFTMAVKDKWEGNVNICTDDNLSIDTLADIVMDELSIHKPKVWLGSGANWKGDNRFLSAHNSKAWLEYCWQPKYHSSYEAVQQAVRDLR